MLLLSDENKIRNDSKDKKETESEMSTNGLSLGDYYNDFYLPSKMLANISKYCQ